MTCINLHATHHVCASTEGTHIFGALENIKHWLPRENFDGKDTCMHGAAETDIHSISLNRVYRACSRKTEMGDQ
jgi:hypothetical protein